MSFKKILVASAFAVVSSAGYSFANDGNEGISIRDDLHNNNADQGIILDEGRSSTLGAPPVYVDEAPGAYVEEPPVDEGSEFGISDPERTNE